MEDLRLIRSFVAVVANGNNFSAAARDMSLTSAAVSKNIKRLEQQLHVRLFHRTTRSQSLTAEGEAIHERYLVALEQIDLARELAAAKSQDRHGTVRITLTRSFGRHVIMPLLDDFMRKYPAIRLDVNLEDRLTDLVREGYDIGVRGGPQPDTGSYIIRPLASLQPLVCGAPAYLAQHGVPAQPADLTQHNCIAWRQPGTGRIAPWDFRVHGRMESFQPSGGLICSDIDTIARMAAVGAGLAVVGSYRAAPFLARGALQEVLAEFRPSPRKFYLHYPSRQFLARRVRLLIDHLIEHVNHD